MGSKNFKAELSDEEEDCLYAAFKEWRVNGFAKQSCPRCGGKLLFTVAGNSYEIRCENESCLKLTSRGL